MQKYTESDHVIDNGVDMGADDSLSLALVVAVVRSLASLGRSTPDIRRYGCIPLDQASLAADTGWYLLVKPPADLF